MTTISFFNVILKTNFVFGTLPIKKHLVKNPKEYADEEIYTRRYFSNQYSYRITSLGLIFTAFSLAAISYSVIRSCQDIIKFSNKYFDSCFQKTFCLSVIETIIFNLHPICGMYIMIFHKFQLKILCLKQVTNFLEENHQQKINFRKPMCLFIFVQVMCSISALLKKNHLSTWGNWFDYYYMAAFLSFDCLVYTLFHVITETYKYINEEINRIGNEKQMHKIWLQTLEQQHWKMGDLAVDLNSCFGINLLFAWPYDIVQTISFLTTVTDFSNWKNSRIIIMDILERLVRIIIFLFRIVYFGRTGTQLTNQAEMTEIYIKKLKLGRFANNDASLNKLIRIFSVRLNSRKIKLTANDFLLINSRLIQSITNIRTTPKHKKFLTDMELDDALLIQNLQLFSLKCFQFFGVIVTYWIVLAQFKNNK